MPIELGLDDAEYRGRCDRRVNRIAAAHEHLHAGERRQRLTRRNHAVFG